MWKKFDSKKIVGLLLKGDDTVPTTRWWNHLILLLFIWKKISILYIPSYRDGYRLGYIPADGSPRLQSEVLYHRIVGIKNGYEDVKFFAVDLGSKEIPLRLEKYTHKNDPALHNIPIL